MRATWSLTESGVGCHQHSDMHAYMFVVSPKGNFFGVYYTSSKALALNKWHVECGRNPETRILQTGSSHAMSYMCQAAHGMVYSLCDEAWGKYLQAEAEVGIKLC